MKFIKKWLTRLLVVMGIFSLIPTFFALYTASHIKEKRIKVKDTIVLTLNLASPIQEEATKPGLAFFKGPGLSMLEVMAVLKNAAKDNRVKGIVINGRTNHLGLAQLQELRSMLLDLQRHGKFAIFYTDTFGELGSSLKSYYLASSCKEIWMQPSGELNLTGIQLEIPFIAKILKEWGINAQIGTREEYKNAMSFITDESFSPANEESFKSLAKGIYGQMLSGISKDREIPQETLQHISQNTPMLSGRESLQLDLIDRLVFEDDLEKLMKERLKTEEVAFVKLRHYVAILRHENAKLIKSTFKSDDKMTRIALIYATGEIVRNSAPDNPILHTQTMQLEPAEIRKAVDEILKDKSIKAVVIRVDSPGGSAVASDSIWHSLNRLKEKKIPIVISMGNAAASGGYWIAMSGDHIVANPLTITGSIGVIAGKISAKGLLEKLNVNMGIVSEGPNTQLWSMVEPYTPEQWNLIQKNLDRIYESFLQKVSKGRPNLSPEHIREVAKGRAWLGFEAKEYGLIDELGGISTALDRAKTLIKIPLHSTVPIEVFPKPKTFGDFVTMLVNGEDEDKDSLFDDLLIMVQSLRTLIGPNFTDQTVKAIVPTVR